MNKLYEIADTYNAVFQRIEDEAEDDGSFDQHLKLMLDAVQDEFDEKMKACCMIVREFDLHIEACDAEKKRLQERASKIKLRTESLKSYMMQAMKGTQQEKVKTDLFTVSIRKNPPSVFVTDANQIPGKFITEKIEYVISKSAIASDLKAGLEVAGAELVQTERLHIQ